MLAPYRDRFSWDATIHSIADIEALPYPPKMVNIKPSRLGGLRNLLDAFDYCAERGHRQLWRRPVRARRRARPDPVPGLAVSRRRAKRRRADRLQPARDARRPALQPARAARPRRRAFAGARRSACSARAQRSARSQLPCRLSVSPRKEQLRSVAAFRRGREMFMTSQARKSDRGTSSQWLSRRCAVCWACRGRALGGDRRHGRTGRGAGGGAPQARRTRPGLGARDGQRARHERADHERALRAGQQLQRQPPSGLDARHADDRRQGHRQRHDGRLPQRARRAHHTVLPGRAPARGGRRSERARRDRAQDSAHSGHIMVLLSHGRYTSSYGPIYVFAHALHPPKPKDPPPAPVSPAPPGSAFEGSGDVDLVPQPVRRGQPRLDHRAGPCRGRHARCSSRARTARPTTGASSRPSSCRRCTPTG